MEVSRHTIQMQQHSPVAIQHAFEHSVMRVITVLSGKIVLKRDADANPNRLPVSDLYSMIRIGGYLEGFILLSINRGPAMEIAAGMSMNHPDKITDALLHDAIGEMVNQIAGKFRTVLSEFGRDFTITTPEIADHAPDINFSDYDERLTNSIAFQFDDEFFTVALLANCNFCA
ncbi:MAG: chemotaxis protein CheX [Candidatus Zixiibacteriota bacterium]